MPSAATKGHTVAREVIVGFDGSEHALDGLALGGLLAALVEREPLLAAVYQDGHGYSQPERHELEHEVVEHADRLRQAAREATGGHDIELTTVLAESPARGLHDLATEREAMMIALGSTHRGSLGRITPGSVAQRLLNGAPCPIAIAPAGLRERELAVGAVGVAFDGSHESRRALRAAVDLARAADAHVDLIGAVHVPHGAIGEPYALAGGSRALADRLRADLEQRMREAMQSVPRENRGATDVHVGDAVKVLSARSRDLDLLVCGSRGYGLLRQVLLGGVSGELLRHAECPLLVVPRGGELR